ncbi:MAG: GHKL domain-containing protein [Deltaproteobacteria bacterium]|nr:GHKL domain-containing protein [Deltaproteobacteria bacterium]
MNQDVSCRITNSIIQYAKRHSKSVLPFFDDLGVALEHLADTNSWIDRKTINHVYSRLPQFFHDEDIIFKIGRESPTLEAWGVLDSVFRMIGEPKLIYHQSRKFISYFYKNIFVRLSEKEENSIVLEFDSSLSEADVWYLKGALSGIPEYWNLGVAHIENRSPHACVITWAEKPQFFGEEKIPTHLSPQLIQEAVARLEEQNEKLEKTNRELRETNKKLKESVRQQVQTEKMSSIGQLATGIAHEINNPLGFIISNVTRIREYVTKLFQILEMYEQMSGDLPQNVSYKTERILRKLDEYTAQNNLQSIKEDFPLILAETSEGLGRVKQVVSDLNHFAHAGSEKTELCDIQQCIEISLNMLRYDLRRKVTINKDYGEIPEVPGHPTQLNQVFLNLFLNAYQAIEGHGTIKISTFKENGRVIVTVKDSGCGIQTENLERIFEPFFTTKKPGEGTGLGLSTAFGIIKNHKGDIEVESQPGVGSVFRVKLPYEAESLLKNGVS